ncbi:MAG: hypothetical protein QM831_38190 [Kofleriaceae bacterium]
MRGLAWLAAITCSGTACSTNDARVIETTQAPVAAPLDAAETPPPPVIQPPRFAIPDGAISTVVVPDNARAAVTAALDGSSIRLWPSFDGKHEPVVIPGTATELRLIATTDGFSILERDQIGQLVLVTTTLEGGVIDRRTLALDRPVQQIVATNHVFFALTDDQHVIGVDAHGAILNSLMPDAGEPISRLIARGDHAVAVIPLDEHHLFLRGIDAQIEWAPRSAKLALSGTIALSPDGTRVAGTNLDKSGTEDVVVRDLATGNRVAKHHPEDAAGDGTFEVEWVTAKTLVISHQGSTWRWNVGDSISDAFDGPLFTFAASTRAGMVSSSNASLVLWGDGDSPQRLGYHFMDVKDMVPTGAGWLATDGTSIVRMNDAFELKHTFELPTQVGSTVSLLDTHHAIVTNADVHTLVTLGKPEADIVLNTSGYHLELDRLSGWAASFTQHGLEFLHWDGKEMSSPMSSPLSANATSRLYASGKIAAQAEVVDDHWIEVTELYPLAKVKLDGTAFRTKKRRVRRLERPDPNRFDFNDELDAAIDDDVITQKSPDGAWVAELAHHRISLRGRDGAEQWTRSASGAVGLAWSAGGQLVAFGPGVTTVDLASGAFVGARCGWTFKLEKFIDSNQPNPTGSAEICEAR